MSATMLGQGALDMSAINQVPRRRFSIDSGLGKMDVPPMDRAYSPLAGRNAVTEVISNLEGFLVFLGGLLPFDSCCQLSREFQRIAGNVVDVVQRQQQEGIESERQIADLQAQIEDLTAQVGRLTAESEAKSGRIGDLASQLQDFTGLKSSYNELFSNYASLDRERTAEELETQRAQALIEDLTAQVGRSNGEIAELQQQIADRDEEIFNLRRQIDETNGFRELARKAGGYVSDRDDVIEELQREKARLEAEMAAGSKRRK
jgi:chromosome segregation ATPase